MCVYIVSKHQKINRRQCQVLGEALTALFGDSQKRGRRGERQEAGGETQEAGGAPHWEEPGDFRLKGSGGDREEKIPGSGSICQIPVELHVLPSYCSPSLELYRLVVFIL